MTIERIFIERVYRDESARILATLIRLLGDFDLAEEVTQEAFAVAVEQWPRQGVPETHGHGWCPRRATKPSI